MIMEVINMESILLLFIMPLTYILSFVYAGFIRKYIFCNIESKKYLIFSTLIIVIFVIIDYELHLIPKDNIFGIITSFVLYFLFTPFSISLINSFYILSTKIRIILSLVVLFISIPIMFNSYMFLISILY